MMRRVKTTDRTDLPVPTGLQAHTFDVEGDEYVVFAFPVPSPCPPAGLTQAESEVVSGVLRGQSNADIAVARGTSRNTVANQLQAIYRKLGVSGRAQLMRRCRESAR
jgi:DNA-binding CsgD family transcriptional regulator